MSSVDYTLPKGLFPPIDEFFELLSLERDNKKVKNANNTESDYNTEEYKANEYNNDTEIKTVIDYMKNGKLPPVNLMVKYSSLNGRLKDFYGSNDKQLTDYFEIAVETANELWIDYIWEKYIRSVNDKDTIGDNTVDNKDGSVNNKDRSDRSDYSFLLSQSVLENILLSGNLNGLYYLYNKYKISFNILVNDDLFDKLPEISAIFVIENKYYNLPKMFIPFISGDPIHSQHNNTTNTRITNILDSTCKNNYVKLLTTIINDKIGSIEQFVIDEIRYLVDFNGLLLYYICKYITNIDFIRSISINYTLGSLSIGFIGAGMGNMIDNLNLMIELRANISDTQICDLIKVSCSKNNTSVTKKLLTVYHGEDLDTSFINVCVNGNLELAQIFINRNVDYNKGLYLAIINDHLEIVKLILDKYNNCDITFPHNISNEMFKYLHEYIVNRHRLLN